MADYNQDIIRTVRISTEIDEAGLKQASSTLDNFYKKYQDKTMKVDTKEFNIALESIKKIQSVLADTKKNSPQMTGVIDTMGKGLDTAAEHFKDTMAFFTDGSTAKGLNDILGKISEGYSLRIADLGERLSILKSNIEGIMSELKDVGAISKGFAGKNLLNLSNLNVSELEPALVKLRNLMQLQQELDSFNGSPLSRDQFTSNQSTNELGQYITKLESNLSELKRLNLETIRELNQRNDIIGNLMSRSTGYNDYEIDTLIENAQEEKEAYQSALNNLKEYMQERQSILERMQDNNHLFSAQELSDFRRQIDEDLTRGKGQLSKLQSVSFPDGGNGDAVVQDYSELLRILGEIKDALKPITDAFVNGETALGKMAQEGSTSLETLLGKLKELYDLMGKINDKPMAITNVFNQKATTQMTNQAQLNIYKEQATALLEIIDQLSLAQNQLSNSNPANWMQAFKATGMDIATFFNTFDSFNADALAGKIAGADTVVKIKTVIGTLDSYKNKLVELTNQINILNPGSVDLSMLSQLDTFESRIAATRQQPASTVQDNIKSGIDETEIAQINTLQDAIHAVSKAIGRKNAGFIKEGEIVGQVTAKEISDIGNLINIINTGVLGALDNLKPKLMQAFVLPPIDQSNLQASFDLIYNKFVELQDKVGQLVFNVNAKDNIVNDTQFAQSFDKIEDSSQIIVDEWDKATGMWIQAKNRVTGEIFDDINEVGYAFDKLKGKYVSKDGLFIGTKEEALSRLQNYPSKVDTAQNNWATVIVEAINTQGGNIVNAIKLLLPKTSTSVLNESELISAFQILSQNVSAWSLQHYDSPGAFFQKILNNKIPLDTGISDALKTLGMMSKDGTPTFTLADSGLRNLGVAIAEQVVVPARASSLDLSAQLIPKLNQAVELGASVPKILSAFNDGTQVFELQTRMPGKNIAKDNTGSLFDATDAQIDQLLHTFDVMSKVGLYFEHVGDNVLFDKKQGFSIVDLDPKKTMYTASSDPQDMMQSFLSNVSRLYNLDKGDREMFKDRVKARAALPPEQRLVNADTVAAERKNAQFETKNSVKVTPTMDKGAVAEVVKQNIEETPATVKITPIVDKGEIAQVAQDNTAVPKNEPDTFDQNKWDEFQRIKPVNFDHMTLGTIEQIKTQMMNLLSQEQQDIIAKIPFLVDAQDSDISFGDFNPAFSKQMEKFLAPNNLTAKGAIVSEQAIQGEAQSAEDAAKQFIDAANAKREFVEANKQVAESADESEKKIKKEADAVQQAKNTIDAVADNSVQPDNWDKTTQKQTDHGEDPFWMSRSKIGKTDNAFKTITEAWSAIRDEDGELTGEMQLDTVTIINDYKKRTDAITKESEKIKVAQANLRKFLTQFDNKTMGEGVKLNGYADLLALSNSASFGIGDIDKAYAAMSNLDAEYNKVVQSFRKGSSSMNPFVNAVNSMGKMEDVLYSLELDFKSLNKQPDDLKNKLIDLYKRFDSLTGEKDLYKYAEGFGNLKVAINSVTEAISQQRKEQKIQTKSSMLELDKEASMQSLINMQEKWRQQSLLTNEVDAKIDAMFNSLVDITNRDDLGLWIKQWGILKAEVAGAKQEQDSFNASAKADEKQHSVTEKEYNKLFGDIEKQRASQFTNLIGLRNSYQIKGAKEDNGSQMQLFYAEQQKKVQEQINVLARQVTLTDSEKIRLKDMQLSKERQILEIQQQQAAIAYDKANFVSQGKKIDEMYASGYLSQERYQAWDSQLNTFRLNKDSMNPEDLAQTTAELTQLYNQYIKLGQASKSFFNKGGILGKDTWFSKDQLKDTSGSLNALYNQIIGGEQFSGFKTQITGVNETMGKLTFAADDCKGSITTYTLSVDTATGATSLLAGQAKRVLTPMQQLGQALKKNFTGLLHAFIGGTGIYKFAQVIRSGIGSVRDLDIALTELKKVTNETEKTYNKFLDTASKTAAKVGSTIKDFTSSTADWARLGYAIKDAAKFAESTQILMNVSEFTDVSKATDTLISTVQAFGYTADTSMDVVDLLNTIEIPVPLS